MEKGTKQNISLQDLMNALKDADNSSHPVEGWNPDYCGEMDMIIKSDGTWWHEGSKIKRQELVKLFASILRKDLDGDTYLVTPVEKIKIKVERGHFLITDVHSEGEKQNQKVFFTTNLGEYIKLSDANPMRVDTHSSTLEPSPYVTIRGRLEALLSRSVFYTVVDLASEVEMSNGKQLGIWSFGSFFPLGPIDSHKI
jgi:hypothetical protein